MKLFKQALLVISTIFVLVGCKKSSDAGSTPPAQAADVYVAGLVTDSTSGIAKHAIWKNGQLVNTVASTFGVYPSAMAMLDTDVYTAGAETGTKPAYSKNFGPSVYLNLGTYTMGEGECIAFQGNDMYIGGIVSNDGFQTTQAVYWKNGVLNLLSQGTDISSIAVSGTDVYIYGYSFSYSNATTQNFYWKNGGQPVLVNGFAGLSSIAVSGSDIYVAGADGNGKAAFSKNGNMTTLADSGHVLSIAVNGSDVFMVGLQFNKNALQSATYWKNKTAKTLFNTSLNSYSGGICLNGADVYYVGQILDTNTDPFISHGAYYWKNGTPVELQRGNNKIRDIINIAVVPTQ